MSNLLGLLAITASLSLFAHIELVDSVNINRMSALKKEELLALDKEVSDFYKESYEMLDKKNVTYDEQLYKTIRSIRHTTVVNLFDFRFTNEELMRKSAGSKVDSSLCKQQLKFVRLLAEQYQAFSKPLPLSVIDFLESSGRTEAGILNGNFVWLGSHPSCVRAKISASSIKDLSNGQLSDDRDVIGRYCVAHLRAKSWPKWDMYFENRITIRKGLCVPESCHTAVYRDDPEVRNDIDYLTRHNLLPPYSTDNYETVELYCLPDEDSPLREYDLGTKLFIAFIAFWIILTIHTNVKYHQRLEAMRKLRESVDIRMIINQKLVPNDDQDHPSDIEEKVNKKAITDNNIDGIKGMLTLAVEGKSQASSLNVTPLPSDMDESDIELIKPFIAESEKKKKRKVITKNRQSNNNIKEDNSERIDFVRAFSIKANLDFLLQDREIRVQTETTNTEQSNQVVQQVDQKRSSHSQLSAVNRRTSSSNEALIKDIQQCDGDGNQLSKVAIVTGQEANKRCRKPNRVDICVLDGVKWFGTMYIIYGHTMMFFFGLVNDMRFANERMFDITMVATINTLQIVGLFYITTGILLTYLAFSKTKASQLYKPAFWIMAMIGRYFRLIPVYLLVFWFAKHVSPNLGAGYGWEDYRVDEEHPRTYCGTESWMTMITMSAAETKIPMDCVPQAWYLSNDFRTLLVLPFYVVLIGLNQKAGFAAVAATFAFSTYRLTSSLRGANIDFKIILNWQPHVYSLMVDRLHEIYTDFAVRLSTYLMGVIVGRLLYLYEIREIKRWPKWLENYGLKVSLTLGMTFFFGAQVIASPWVNQFLPKREEVNSDLVVLLIPLFKSAMEICICITLLLLLTGGGFNWVTAILSSKISKIMSNISYAVFLTHIEIMYKPPSVRIESSYWYLMLYSCFYLVQSHIVSFFIYLLYEMPIHNVLRYVFKRALKATSGE